MTDEKGRIVRVIEWKPIEKFGPSEHQDVFVVNPGEEPRKAVYELENQKFRIDGERYSPEDFQYWVGINELLGQLGG